MIVYLNVAIKGFYRSRGWRYQIFEVTYGDREFMNGRKVVFNGIYRGFYVTNTD